MDRFFYRKDTFHEYLLFCRKIGIFIHIIHFYVIKMEIKISIQTNQEVMA
jgi:hypothetical protein